MARANGECLNFRVKCSSIVPEMDRHDTFQRWPRPPACLTCDQVAMPPAGVRVAVAGLVMVRQRPGTAKGVIFITLEDETGICNVIVWRAVYERFRRAVIAGRCLRVTGKLQREAGVTHLIAERIDDISAWLDDLLAEAGTVSPICPPAEPFTMRSAPLCLCRRPAKVGVHRPC